MTNTIAVSVLCIAVAGVGAQWLAWRLRLPAIVLLFAVGLVVGPGLQILLPTQMFGNSVRPLVSLAVAIVVFEGGLALEFRELGAAGEGVLRLWVLALPISFVLATNRCASFRRYGVGNRPPVRRDHGRDGPDRRLALAVSHAAGATSRFLSEVGSNRQRPRRSVIRTKLTVNL